MGGALVAGGGQRAGADAIVDLSGPDSWSGVPDTVTAARDITVPFLVAAADDDSGIDVDALREAVRGVAGAAQGVRRHARRARLGHGRRGCADRHSTPLDVRITAAGQEGAGLGAGLNG